MGTALQLRRGQTFYLDQIDLRASTTSTVDEGVSGLRARGAFADLAWGGLAGEEQEFVLLGNPDGTFTRRRFYRGAAWMTAGSSVVLDQLDAQGHAVGGSVTSDAGEVRVSVVSHVLSAVARRGLRSDREHPRRRRSRLVPAMYFDLSPDPPR